MKKIALFALIALTGFACSSTKITSDYDKSVDFTKYKTAEYYGWEENSNKILTRFDQERMFSATHTKKATNTKPTHSGIQ